MSEQARYSWLNAVKGIVYPHVQVDERRRDECFSGKWVVITGASRGIGKALAYRMIEAGANLYLIARSKEELQKIAADAEARGCEVMYKAIDLRNRDALSCFCEELKEHLSSVDFVFCNAGKSIHRTIKDAAERLHDFDRTMELNYRSMVALVLTLLPALQRSEGTVVYSSSVSSLYPPAPGWSAYHASKCAANVWCETANVEWGKMGVKVKVAYLPLVHTQMSDATVAYREMPAYSAEEAADILVKLSMSSRFSYKPWWARLSAPVANALSPVVRYFYKRKL
ncbi:MAG: SDR family NAD(P)-dependent oxidoreductase [Prevotellaceae bacterium]|nr:SDR family NAD(P)-dependent oxidoreductase [Candidatus Minthosoma caballi]